MARRAGMTASCVSGPDVRLNFNTSCVDQADCHSLAILRRLEPWWVDFKSNLINLRKPFRRAAWIIASLAPPDSCLYRLSPYQLTGKKLSIPHPDYGLPSPHLFTASDAHPITRSAHSSRFLHCLAQFRVTIDGTRPRIVILNGPD